MKYPVWAIIMLFLVSCTPKEEKNDTLFDLVAPSTTGIHFNNKLSNKKLNIIDYLYYYNGGGVAVGDINNDGLDDIYFTANEGENKLFLNKGDFKFEDITDKAKVAGNADWSTGVTMVDINNDGLLDIYTSAVGDYKGLNSHNELFVNNGDLTFTESSEEYGLNFKGFSTQAAFLDYDHDGDLDMYLLNHSVHGVGTYGSSNFRYQKDEKAGDRFYENLYSDGKKQFKDITDQVGIFSSQIGYGLGVSVADINQDGWSDIYVSNDFHENDYIYINQQDGTFKEELQQRITYTSRYSMGNDVGDLNGDGEPDIVTLDMLPSDPEILLKSAGEDKQEVSDIKKNYGYADQLVRNTLQLNSGKGTFKEVAQLMGVEATDWSWSSLIGDLNNDGYNDLFISNGIYKRPNDLDYIQYIGNLSDVKFSIKNEDSLELEMINRMPSVKIPNHAFQNIDNQKYEDKSKEWGLAQPSFSNGSVLADLDNDGDLDLVVNNVNQEAFVYKNNTDKDSLTNYVRLKLQGVEDNFFGIGAKVSVYAQEKLYRQELNLVHGFQSSGATSLHFGLGTSNKIDSILIEWPKGGVQRLLNLKPNQEITILQEKNARSNHFGELVQNVLLSPAEINFSFNHQENVNFKDYNREYLIPYKLSTEGPAFAVGDINSDGLDDLFAGGAHGQEPQIYVQNLEGEFEIKPQLWTQRHNFYEDVDANFFDADGDGDLDLYVVSGGSEYNEGRPPLEDRLYLNNGQGDFTPSSSYIPNKAKNGAVVKPLDFDKDGDIDLFIGNRSVPGDYGLSPESYLLVNSGDGHYEVDQQWTLGMVTDAQWADIDGDDDQDLIIVGDWMPITVLTNKNNEFEKVSLSGLENTEGWWRSVELKDIDADGDIDIIAGNIGENIRLRPTIERPLTLYVGDFDDNGKSDPVIFYYKGESFIPLASKDLLSKQMPIINKKFNTYNSFSEVSKIDDMFSKESISKSSISYVRDFKTSLFVNNGSGEFSKRVLPTEVQYSTVNDILVKDFNQDGFFDILFVGNFLGNSIGLGNSGAQSQVLLLADKNGNYEIVNVEDEELNNEEFRKIEVVEVGEEEYLFGIRNNDSVRILKVINNPN